MITLRINHRAGDDPAQHRVTVSLEGDGLVPMSFTAAFLFTFTQQERNDIRWYLETYLQYPLAPADKRAARVEALMADLGERLFRAVFEADRDAFKLWARLQADLNATRIEVAGDHPRAWTLPWELLRDPDTETYLALHAQAFVRVHLGPAREVRLPQTAADEAIRILLVIARPGLEADVPYRSVARRVVAALGNRDAVRLDVLRPPTYAALAQRLRQAKEAGVPYHVVHFDGHGMYEDLSPRQPLSGLLRELRMLVFGAPRQGEHGYLLFENPEVEENVRPVDGPTLGDLLVETGVGVLVLNACRSGRAAEYTDAQEDDGLNALAESNGQVHTFSSSSKAMFISVLTSDYNRVRAFGSLAQEVMDAGVAGVVAMRHNVYVVTAARFVAELYAALLRGRTLGQAVTDGRKHLAANPMRAILYEPVSLQDWTVPLVYEPVPIRLFPEQQETEAGAIQITLDESAATPGRGDQVDLPSPPDIGFFGRDKTLLRLDRAFDRHTIILLYGYAGSGKTTAATEFARWYGLTGGVAGPVLFTSFEQYLPLPRLLDVIGRVFGPALEQNGIHWLALEDSTRREVALQILTQLPVLWIWDNLAEVTGFPSGTDSAWSEAEQRALADFLRDLQQRTQAKVLLTSRRDEQGWLGELPARIAVPPMPMRERVQLARALAHRYGTDIEPLEAWIPLLRFTGGNPLTLTVVVGQALRSGLTTKREISHFVRRLQAGEAAFDDAEAQSRSRSLGASLAYGFEHAFSEAERARLALLHLFQGFVQVGTLRVMGDPDTDWSLEPIRGLTRDDWLPLLDRAAEVGLLHAHGGGFYRIHPALPWYFHRLFHEHYPDASVAAGEDGGPPSPVSRRRAARAYVEALGTLSEYYHRQYERGNRAVIAPLTVEEANLLHARRLALQHEWWKPAIRAMQGIRMLYEHTGRRTEWARLVEEIVPHYVDSATEESLPNLEDQWSLVTQYRVQLAREARHWVEAEQLQRVFVHWCRSKVEKTLEASEDTLNGTTLDLVRMLATSLHDLGQILREQDNLGCVSTYEEAAALLNRISDEPSQAVVAFNLGHAYKNISALHNLDEAERWYRRSLDLTPSEDRMGHAQCLGQLGLVAYERFLEAREAGAPEDTLAAHLNEAAQQYHRALDLLPADAVEDIAVVHNQLGNIYSDAGDTARCVYHYREAVRHNETAGNVFRATATRYNVAIALARAERFADALDYSRAALRGFEVFGERAAAEIQQTEHLIAQIEAGEFDEQLFAVVEIREVEQSLRQNPEYISIDSKAFSLLAAGKIQDAIKVCGSQVIAKDTSYLAAAGTRGVQIREATHGYANLDEVMAIVETAHQNSNEELINHWIAVYLQANINAGLISSVEAALERLSMDLPNGTLEESLLVTKILLQQNLWLRDTEPTEEPVNSNSGQVRHKKASVNDQESHNGTWAEHILSGYRALSARQSGLAEVRFQSGKEALETSGNQLGILASKYLYAQSLIELGKLDKAKNTLHEVLQAAREMELYVLSAKTAYALANIEYRQGSIKLSRDCFWASAQASNKAGFYLGEIRARLNLGISAAKLDDFSVALSWLKRSSDGYEVVLTGLSQLQRRLEEFRPGQTIAEKNRIPRELYPSLFPLADLASRKAGAVLFQQLLWTSNLSVVFREAQSSLQTMAQIHEYQKHFDAAAEANQRLASLKMMYDDPSNLFPAQDLVEVGRLYNMGERPELALKALSDARNLLQQTPDSYCCAKLYKELAILEVTKENYRTALSRLRDAIRYLEKENKPLDLIRLLFRKARLELRMGYISSSVETFRRILVETEDGEEEEILVLAEQAQIALRKLKG